MIAENYNAGWKFWVSGNAFEMVWDVPEQAREVILPHDAMREQPAYAGSPNGGNTGYRDGGVYTYVKKMYVDPEELHHTLMLKFDGVYMNAFVYVNEQLAAQHPYGYTGFFVNLNDFLCPGRENEIRVIVRNGAMPNSRWYSGGGIYQNVYLLRGGEIYLVPEQVQVTTRHLEDSYALLQIETKIKNRTCLTAGLELETVILDEDGKEAARERIPLVLAGQEERRMRQYLAVDQPRCWSVHTPALYRCISRLYEEGQLADENETFFGIRTVAADTRKGLRINGKTEKLRGACIHHDSGLLGSVVYEEAEIRRVQILKNAGFNAIRMSHHPASPALLRACDRVGMYVMDEAFDMWSRLKSDYDYGLFFQEWWERDVEAMVEKDFNHPSVILYSIGNEIPEIGTPQGSRLCHAINEKVKGLDGTRPTLASVNGVFAAGDCIGEIMGDLAAQLADQGQMETGGNVNDFMSMMDQHLDRIVTHPSITRRLEMAFANTDIAGYNYMTARYEMDHKAYPNRVIVGSETYPPEIARNWALVKKLPHVIGDFTWTGWDYIGEAGIGIVGYQPGEGGLGAQYPCQLAYCGDMDLTGWRRPTSYYREIVFGLRKKPYITVQNPYKYGMKGQKTVWVISDNQPFWDYPGREGKPVVVEVYAPGEEVELFCNGKSLGKKVSGAEAGYRILYETVYEPGTLRAVVYEKGKAVDSCELSTPDGEGSLRLSAEVLESEGQGGQLIYLRICNQDQRGTIVTHRERILHASLLGEGEILGFGSADPKSAYSYQTQETRTWMGQALLIVRKKDQDPVKITVSSEDEESALVV